MFKRLMNGVFDIFWTAELFSFFFLSLSFQKNNDKKILV